MTWKHTAAGVVGPRNTGEILMAEGGHMKRILRLTDNSV